MWEESLARLEETVARALRRARSLQADNADLRRENLELREKLEELERENRDGRLQAERFRQDRFQIREKLERAMGSLAALEDSVADAKTRAKAEYE